jgi:hypothetical protein
MAAFTQLVTHLLREGNVRLSEPPRLPPGERDGVLAALAAEHAAHALDVAGPPLPFVPAVALAATEFLAWACWFLVHRGEPAAGVERTLPALAGPHGAAEHLSGDVVLRFLGGVYRRARAAGAQDVLTARTEDVLRRWPLSGVLADLDAPPAAPLDLGGHPGLVLLYAERLAGRPRPAWVGEGAVREVVELVFAERGLPVPAPEGV